MPLFTKYELKMYNLLKQLFPICRSITGNGVRETLAILKKEVPELQIYEVPSGTSVFDWTVPKEWNIKDAWVKNSKGEKVIDFQKTNLHVLGYSIPIHQKISKAELLEHIYTIPEQPNLIPYVTSYYKRRWGFCISEIEKNKLDDGEYEVFIDSSLEQGSLSHGEILIPGRSKKEIFLSTYVCHPSMANNELSGPVIAINLAKWIKTIDRNFSYRIIFVPETIGSITYLSRNLQYLKENVIAGYVLTCLGDNNHFSYIESRYGNTLSDKVAKLILKYTDPDYKTYSFLDRGSDERQYCAPGVDLPMCSITRSKYGEYAEYHTSGDNLDFVSEEGLNGSFELFKKIIATIENNKIYTNKVLCEPQMGKRGLYPTISTKKSGLEVRDLMNVLAYIDGTNDLIDLCNITNTSAETCTEIINKLLNGGVIQEK